MNNVPNNVLFLLGAAVVGLVGAASVFIIERFQENKRHRVTRDVARIDDELIQLREELKYLRQLQNERFVTVCK